MTKEYQPTMQTWRDYAVLPPEEQERIVKEINKKALYSGLEPKLAGRYSEVGEGVRSRRNQIFCGKSRLVEYFK